MSKNQSAPGGRRWWWCCKINYALFLLVWLAGWAVAIVPLTFRKVPDALFNQVHLGMSQAEVLAIVGAPNQKGAATEGGEVWQYYLQEFGWEAFTSPACVRLDASGMVTDIWIH